MTNDEVSARLGIKPKEGALIEATLGFGDGQSAADALHMNYRSYRNKMGHIRRTMKIQSTLHLCVVYDRIRRGLSASEAMQGLAT